MGWQIALGVDTSTSSVAHCACVFVRQNKYSPSFPERLRLYRDGVADANERNDVGVNTLTGINFVDVAGLEWPFFAGFDNLKG